METVKRFRLVMTKNGHCWPMFTGEQFVLDGALFQEHAEGDLVRAADAVRLQESERYAWKNTRLLDGECMRFRAALEQIAGSKEYIAPCAIAMEALGSSDSASTGV